MKLHLFRRLALRLTAVLACLALAAGFCVPGRLRRCRRL